jgi:hypothetical protein
VKRKPEIIPVVSGRNQAEIAAITFTIQRIIPTINGLNGEITIKGEIIAPIFDHETQEAWASVR